MNILHLSDTHGGRLTGLDTWGDIVVHSGDFGPDVDGFDWLADTAGRQRNHQKNWICHHGKTIRGNIGARPLILVPGNHDYHDYYNDLLDFGIDARVLVDEQMTLGGVTFYGLPWVPWCGPWNWTASDDEIYGRMVTSGVESMLSGGEIDVFVAHGPMRGMLDRTRGQNVGSISLRKMFDTWGLAKALLHGHIHEDPGQRMYENMLVSNAACTTRRIVV